MRLQKTIGIVAVLALLGMMTCPALAAIQSNHTQSPDHCSSEKQPKKQGQDMHGCCDQNAVSVLKVHAPFETSAIEIVSPIISIDRLLAFGDENDLPSFEKTGDHLSKLSILRL